MSAAVLVIDMQHDVLATCTTATDVLTVVNALAARARDAGCPVVLVRQHDDELIAGEHGWQLDDRLVQHPSDQIVDKHYRDAFAATELAALLRMLEVQRVVVCGAHSDYCVQTSALSALAQGFDLTLVADGHAAEDTIIDGASIPGPVVSGFVNARMATLRYPGRQVDVLAAADVALS